jgi:hypothetical protein
MGTFQALGAEVAKRKQDLSNAVFPLYPVFRLNVIKYSGKLATFPHLRPRGLTPWPAFSRRFAVSGVHWADFSATYTP